MIRVAKAWNLDRWPILYGCYVGGIQDICLQYTKTLTVFGPGGISELQLTPDFALGLGRDGQQPYWLTDRWGNLDVVGSEAGGELYWTDMTLTDCEAHPRPYCPVAGAAVYRAGWSASMAGGEAR
jgi:hypothetical protein